MSSDLTPAEARLVRALCTAGPLGITPMGLSKALSLSTTTVGNLLLTVERKGFCARERYGMRIYLRPTSVALAYVTAAAGTASFTDASIRVFRRRRPRAPG
jgi:DNA-binding IclR family transcriptional regulator